MAGSSGMHFARAAYRAGMVSRALLARWGIEHVRFRLRGSTDERTAQVLSQVKELLDGVPEREIARMGPDLLAGVLPRIYPPMLEAGGLAALLRSAAVDAGVPASVEVAAGPDHPPEVDMTVYLSWLATLARASPETRVTISVREGQDTLAFEVIGPAAGSDGDLGRVRDRVEALGGQLTIRSERDGRTCASGSLPLS